jgi:hypothetical protein
VVRLAPTCPCRTLQVSVVQQLGDPGQSVAQVSQQQRLKEAASQWSNHSKHSSQHGC